MKNLFGSYTFKMWEVGLLKLGLFSAGLYIGALYSDVVSQYNALLWIIFIVMMVYFIVYLFKK